MERKYTMCWSLVSREENIFYNCEEGYILYRKLKNIASDNFRLLYLDSKIIIVVSIAFQDIVLQKIVVISV